MSRVTIQVANGNRSIVSEKTWIGNMLERLECAVPPAQSVIHTPGAHNHQVLNKVAIEIAHRQIVAGVLARNRLLQEKGSVPMVEEHIFGVWQTRVASRVKYFEEQVRGGAGVEVPAGQRANEAAIGRFHRRLQGQVSVSIAVKRACVSEYDCLVANPDGYVRFVVEVKIIAGDQVESVLWNYIERARNAWQRDSLGRFKYACAVALKHVQGARLDIDSSTLRNHQLRASIIPQICTDHCYGNARNRNHSSSSFLKSVACNEGAVTSA